MLRTRSSLKCVPHRKLIAKVMRTRVHHATRSFFWETCGDGHDAGPGRLETSWNGLKIGVHARIGRRSRLVSSECKKKNLLQVHLLNRSDTVTVYYLLRHRQDSNLRRHCLVDTLWYGFETRIAFSGNSTNIILFIFTYQNFTVDSTCDRIIDQAPIKFTLDRNCAHTSFLESSQRNPVETTKPRADLRRVSTRRRERRHGCEYHVPARISKPIPDSHRLPTLGSNQPAFEAHRFKQLHAKQIRPFVPSVYTG